MIDFPRHTALVTVPFDPKPAPPSMSPVFDMVRFGEGLLAVLEPYLPLKDTPSSRHEMAVEIAQHFRHYEAMGELLMFADGAVLTGAELVVNGSMGSIAWRTAFWPRQVYEQPGQFLALGYFEEFQLCYADQAPLPPTIVARYGNAPDAYLSVNPTLVGLEATISAGPQFAEAVRRLGLLGLPQRGVTS